MKYAAKVLRYRVGEQQLRPVLRRDFGLVALG